MNKLEKNIYFSNLYNFYKELLTDKQQEIFYSYYFNDNGLSEISNNLSITRQAVLDSLKKTENLLEDYEKKLHLSKIYNSQKEILEKVSFNQSKDLDKILKLWEQ